MSLALKSALPLRPRFGLSTVSNGYKPRALGLHFAGKGRSNKNVLLVTVERIPAKVGGLGEVSKTIPAAISRYSDKDVRVLMPYLAPMAKEDQENQAQVIEFTRADGRKVSYPLTFQPTGLKKTLIGLDGQPTEFELLQKFELFLDKAGKPIAQDDDPNLPVGNWVYAIKNDKYFTPFHDLYLDPNNDRYPRERVQGLGNDAMFKTIMLFDRAAAEFIPHLDTSVADGDGVTLENFDGDAGCIIANDWHTGPLFNELDQKYRQEVGKLFMLHNAFDEPREPWYATSVGMNPEGHLQGVWSPLAMGISHADAVIANRNYMRTLTLTDIAKDHPFVPHLRQKLVEGKVLDMHHGLSNEFDPHNNAFLANKDGFVELAPKPSQAQMEAFKKTNRRALQAKIRQLQAQAGVPEKARFKQDVEGRENYVVMNWVARFDTHQKGFLLLLQEIEGFLRDNPNVQLVIAGKTGDEKMKGWIDALNERVANDPDLQGRLYLPNSFVDKEMVVQINAGSNFTMLPSLYEPYGLTQLESTKLGSIPVVNPVDGLRSTVSEHGMNGKSNIPVKGPAETVWSYGNTGILMEPFNVADYRNGISKPEYMNLLDEKLSGGSPEKGTPKQIGYVELLSAGLSAVQAEAVLKAQKSFHNALNRAVRLSQDPARMFQVQRQGMRFVNEQHQWAPIVSRYVVAIDSTAPKFGQRLQLVG